MILVPSLEGFDSRSAVSLKIQCANLCKAKGAVEKKCYPDSL